MHFSAVSLTTEDASREVKGSDFKLEIGGADGFVSQMSSSPKARPSCHGVAPLSSP